MDTGDYYILVVLSVLIGSVFLYAVFALFAKTNKGAWDQSSQIVGKLRARKYSYKEYGENALRYLLQGKEKPSFWPASEMAASYDLVFNERKQIWRSCIIHTPKGYDLYFTFEIPQRTDGREMCSPEILFEPVSAKTEISFADPNALIGSENNIWILKTADNEAQQRYSASDILVWLEKMSACKEIHIIGSQVTLVIADQKFDPSILKLYPELAAACNAITGFLPDECWK